MSRVAATDAEFTALLRARAYRVTPQRVVIHRLIASEPRHYTAEQVLTLAAPHLPNVSLPTVYATLNLLEDLGVVRRVSAPGESAVYDTRVDLHHHLYCRSCGAVTDVEAPLDTSGAETAARRHGFQPEYVELTLAGLCASCARAGG